MPHGKKGRKSILQRGERNQDDAGQIVEANPGLHFFIRGDLAFHNRDFGSAIQYFSIALDILDHTSPSQLRVNALLRRAQCFFFLGHLDNSIRDCTRALNLSKEIGFQEGICGALLLKIVTLEQTGDIRGAFQLAVFLKTIDFKKAKAHVGRLRQNLKLIFRAREDPTLVDELRVNLMSTGLEFFTKECFKEASEFFVEVVRLVCEVNFVREAHVYQAKCHVKLGEYEEAKDNCTKVLERCPDDEEVRNILKSINTNIQEQKKGKKGKDKKNSKRPSNTPVPVEPVVPEKKPVMNKKQRKFEEYRRMKEAEKIGMDIENKINKDREKQEQTRDEKNREVDGAKSLPVPSYDVKAAIEATSSRREATDKQTTVQAVVGPGARPKKKKVNEISGPTKDKSSTIKKHPDVGCNKSDNTFSERRSSRGFNSPRGSVSKHHVSVDDCPFVSDDPFDSGWDVPNINQTADTSSKSDDGWTVVKSKSQKPKSLTESTSYQNQRAFRSIGLSQDAVTNCNVSNCKEPKWRKHESKSNKRQNSGPDWPSLPRPSFAEDNSSLQDSNTSTTKRFSAKRERQEFKSKLNANEHSRKEPVFPSLAFADNTDYDLQQSHITYNLDRAVLDPFLDCKESANQDLFRTRQNVTSSTGLGASRMPGYSSQPCSNATAAKRTVDVGNTPKSQWETLEQISPLQIHQTLDLVNSTKNTASINNSELLLDTDASSQVGSNSRKVLPEGVSPLCAHFLQDNRKGQAFQRPKPCSTCTKHSKLLYGIWRSSKKEWQVMRPYPKDVNSRVPYQLCRHFSNGVKCQKSLCTFAHGKEELMFWTSERQSDNSWFGRIAHPQVSEHEDEFDNIPKPQEHIRGSLIIRDTRTDKPRPPPAGVYHGNFQLCKWWKSGRVCRFGRYCPYAHGNDELRSWMGYKKEIQEAKSKEDSTCQKPETNADISRNEMVYSVPGVEVSSNQPSSVKIFLRGDERRHTFQWVLTVTFEISQVGKLCQIDLLHHYHDCYRLTEIKGFHNNIEIFSKVATERWSYRLPSWIDMEEGQMKVAVTVSFETKTFNQTFTQCLKFDFGKKPYLLQGLNVDIASEEALNTISATRQNLKLDSSMWTAGSVDLVPFPETAEMSAQDMSLLKKYELPERIENVVSAQILDGKINVENYKRVMHQLLFTEELFMKKAISRSTFNERTEVVYAVNGELFGILKFQENESLQPDDAAGRLLIRNVKSAWLKMTGTSSPNVYEVRIQKVDSESVALKLSSQMCLELQLTVASTISVDVQFQLNRQPLCEWHAAIDRLGPIQLSLLFPKPIAPQVQLIKQEEKRPWNWLSLDPKLNTNQTEVIRRILAPGNYSSPLVVFGPFGTGKTFTLNQAIRHLVTTKHNRILLCTHTNSAADIHVRLLHDYLTKENGLQATRPLRIYQTNRRLNADSEIAKKYGLKENDAYVLPTREDVIRHRVVITTLAMSKHLFDLKLNHGFFTHILVDEAAQALEPEALIPLALAGPNTKVVFTGDHMQMSPEVYSHYARDWGLQRSLPERLFDHYYEKQQLDCSVMILRENYRCHPDILQFPSDNFYGEELIARSEQASHPRLGPLVFFSVHGVEEARENSYINTAEVEEVVKRVKELADDWPVEWKEKDLSHIGVISAYMTQVRAIRTHLRSRELQNVTVESIHNVQGKEFRALFISTVRTSLTCHSFDRQEGESQPLYWEFLSDPKLLNTAITRAMSLVAVVGDPVSLCTAGDCRGNWRDYIRRCHKHGTLHGSSYKEIKTEIDSPLANITLNPEAAVFVPKPVDASSKEFKSPECATQPKLFKGEISGFEERSDWKVDNNAKSSVSDIEDRHAIPTDNNLSGIEVVDAEEDLTQAESMSEDIVCQHQVDCAFQKEVQSEAESEEEEDDVKQDTLDVFEQFRRESFEDETVFPRYFDKIINALVEKCKDTKKKELRLYGSLENAAFPPLQAATISCRKRSKDEKWSDKSSRQEKSSLCDFSADDYQIYNVNGRQKARLVRNLGFHQTPSDRLQRLTASSSCRQHDFLEPELLQQLLLEKPYMYFSCTLRLSSETIRTAFAVVSDTKTPDIKIKGRVRGVFDMDHVVVEKADSQPSSVDEVSRPQGQIVGVLHHIISPHERQFVCRVDFENPEVMLPVNKSVTKIVILSAEGVRGIPLYREIRRGNEKAVMVNVMDHAEFLSGKYMFLVQFLQWRSDCTYPLGIIIRKLPQRYTLDDSMGILFAEHGIRKSFDKECKHEARMKFPPDWSIPAQENQSRKKIDGAFTIDPDNSKDLDDALTLEQLPGSVNRVGVHIADVSYFVEPGTQLDREALFRCTSYYPGHGYQSVPMLPRELSENHCSLLPGKDRLCLSVFLDVSQEGKLIGQPQIKRTIVRSSFQLTYSEAQKIINDHECSVQQLPKDVEKNIRALSALAQRRRKLRLRDAGCDHWSNSNDEENFAAHELVEEMMILANEEIAKFLSAQVPEMAPLRTQLPPKDHKLRDWVKQNGQFIKYSLFLRGFYLEETLKEMTNDVSVSEAAEFKVQKSIWLELCNAAESGDQAKLQKLICNESHHPQLAVANSQFRRIQSKSQYVCERDQPPENVVHFSLRMRCYTHFTSPIRRYMDIQVHRLVLALISQGRSADRPSKEQVAKVCRRSTFAQDNSRKFDRACSKVHLAVKLKENSRETAAVIASIEKEAITLEIPDQEYNHLSKRQRRIKLSNLNPFAINVAQNGSEIVVTWKLRLYIAPIENIIEEAKKEREKVVILLSQGLAGKGEILNMPAEKWLQILKALQEEKFKELKELITKAEGDRQLLSQLPGWNKPSKPYKFPNREKADANMEHFYEKKISLRTFDFVNVQMTAHMTHGVFHPEIQLFKINPSVHICVEHRKYPRECFATTSRYQASRKKYSSVDSYINAWKPVLAMEAATKAVDESDEFAIHLLKVKWKREIGGNLEGSFSLRKEYCESRQIEFYGGDFVCIRVREDSYMKKTRSEISSAFTERAISQEEANLLNEGPVDSTELAVSSSGSNTRHESSNVSENFWVGHCIIKNSKLSKTDTLEITMDLHQSASDFPEELLIGGGHLSTLSVIHRSLPHRRMLAALCSLPSSSKLVHSICLGHEPNQEDFEPPTSSNLSIVREHPKCEFKPLNPYQEEAVKEALVKPFTLVQGPPGTGKSVTGVHIAYWFAKRNKQLQLQRDQDPFDFVLPDSANKSKAPPQVIYCGPSNKSVDVVARYMLRIPQLKIIRVYGDRKEQADFPIPNQRPPLKTSTDEEDRISEEDNELKAVSLHHIIRNDQCPFAGELREYERNFEADRKKGLRTSDKEVEGYRQLIGNAEDWALRSSGAQVILCTCAVAGMPRLANSCRDNIHQCIVDECGMCMELESLVPITCSGVQQVVLIGDHKQLQPVIQDNLAMSLGLSVSMFERLSERAKMLELQYRMPEEICKFPSDYFYEGKLKTDPSVLTRDTRLQSFWPAHTSRSGKNVPMAFCHVEGEEDSSAIKTAQSNEQSKANEKEVRKVVHLARSLVYRNNVDPSKVVILTPYREQRSRISDALKGVLRCKDILVTTITKSQGSEWDYVILSLVRSLSKDEVDSEPSHYWLREHLGFLTDEHQMNVGLTRARKGLCIIGNKNLLVLHPMWQSLIEFYEENHCLVDESDWPEN